MVPGRSPSAPCASPGPLLTVPQVAGLRAAAASRQAALGRAALPCRAAPGCGRSGTGPSLSAAGSAASSFSLAAAATSSARCGRALPPLQRARPPCPRTPLWGGGPGLRAGHHCSPRPHRPDLSRGRVPWPRGTGCSGPRDVGPWGRLSGLSVGPRRAGALATLAWAPRSAGVASRGSGFGRGTSHCSAPLWGQRIEACLLRASLKGKTSAHANCELVNPGILKFSVLWCFVCTSPGKGLSEGFLLEQHGGLP